MGLFHSKAAQPKSGAKSADAATSPATARPRLHGEGSPLEAGHIGRQVLRDSMLLCLASYEEHDPRGFLRHHRHRFSTVSVSAIPGDADVTNAGLFIVAEADWGDDGRYVFVAVRGSVTKEDWIANTKAYPELVSTYGSVHSGWYARSLEIPMQFVKERALQGYIPVFTGHSLGAAVAQVLADELLQWAALADAPAAKKAVCVSFAGPSPFIRARADDINATRRDHFINFVRTSDAVPRVTGWVQQLLQRTTQQQHQAGEGSGGRKVSDKDRSAISAWAWTTLSSTVAAAGSGGVVGGELAVVPADALKRVGVAVAGSVLKFVADSDAFDFVPVGRVIPIDDLAADDGGELKELCPKQMHEHFGQLPELKLGVFTHHRLADYPALFAVASPRLIDASPRCTETIPAGVPGLEDPVVRSLRAEVAGNVATLVMIGERLHCVKTFAADFVAGHTTSSVNALDGNRTQFRCSVNPNVPIKGTHAIVLTTALGSTRKMQVQVHSDHLHPTDLDSVSDLVQKALHMAIYTRPMADRGTTPTALHDSLLERIGQLCIHVPAELLLLLFVKRIDVATDGAGDLVDKLAKYSCGRACLEQVVKHQGAPEAVQVLAKSALNRGAAPWLAAKQMFSGVRVHQLLGLPPDPRAIGQAVVDAVVSDMDEAQAAIAKGVPGSFQQYAIAFKAMLANVSLNFGTPLAGFLGEPGHMRETRVIDEVLQRHGVFREYLSRFVMGGLLAGSATASTSAMWAGGAYLATSVASAPVAAIGAFYGMAMLGLALAEAAGDRERLTNRYAPLRSLGVPIKEDVAWYFLERAVSERVADYMAGSRAGTLDRDALRSGDAFGVMEMDDAFKDNHVSRLALMHALHQLRGVLREYEAVSLVGPSGAGKSSLIDCMMHDVPGYKRRSGKRGHHRTCVPEMLVRPEPSSNAVGGSAPSRSTAILDTIGLTDAMLSYGSDGSDASSAQTTREMLTEIYAKLTSVTIRVVSLSVTPGADAARVDAEMRRKPTVIKRPTLTVFSNADEDGEFDLAEIKAAEENWTARGLVLDLDPRPESLAPRALACFGYRFRKSTTTGSSTAGGGSGTIEPFEVPEYMREGLTKADERFYVWTAADVRAWVSRMIHGSSCSS